jgi:hypothetical protein
MAIRASGERAIDNGGSHEEDAAIQHPVEHCRARMRFRCYERVSNPTNKDPHFIHWL